MAAGGTKRLLIFGLLAAGALGLAPSRASAQASKLEKGPPPPPAEPAPPKPVWDPLHAAKSIEVGKFYLKKGKYGAAINRFREAARLQPGLAEPYLLIGEAYEKKDDPEKAIAAYREYLKVYPTTPDRKKVLKQIKNLEKRAHHEEARGESF
jgi:tetratricopeptide (TPR) repeat protein